MAKIILIPGSSQYFGDTIEGMSRFVGIYEGWGLDGIPPHLEHLRDTQGRSFAHMSLDELEISRGLIDALIEEKAIDLDAVVGTNHRITANNKPPIALVLRSGVCCLQTVSRCIDERTIYKINYG